MSDENDILDEGLNNSEPEIGKKKFNYLKYTFSYIFLMVTVGALMAKIMFNMNPIWERLMFVSFIYIVYAMIVSSIFVFGTYFYRKFISQQAVNKDDHPIWFRILEKGFYSWCCIIVIVYLGIKVF